MRIGFLYVHLHRKTKGTDTLNAIELGIENGQVYPNKIELSKVKIISDVQDEAINGIMKAEVLINGAQYTIDSNTLRKLLKGEEIKYQTPDGLKSNSKYE